jgi:protein disulfide-isomerase A1
VLAAVDATVEKDLGSKFGVRGYPTLKLFKNGKATEYKGGRTEDTIISYMRKTTGPAAKELATTEDVTAFIDSAKVVVVGYFEKLEGTEYDIFMAVAKSDEDNTFGVTTVGSDDVSAPGVVLYKKFDEGKNVFDGNFKEAQLNDFIAKNRIPLVIPFTMEAAAEIFQSSISE